MWKCRFGTNDEDVVDQFGEDARDKADGRDGPPVAHAGGAQHAQSARRQAGHTVAAENEAAGPQFIKAALAPDHHPHAADGRAQRVGQNRLQETPLFNDPQHPLRVGPLLEFRLLEEFAQPVVVNLIRSDCAGPPHHPHHQPGDIRLQERQAPDTGLNLVGGEAGTELIQPVRRLAEHLLRQRLGQGEHLLPDHAALENQNQQDQAALGGDELHVPVAGLGRLRRGDQGGAAGDARQHRRRQWHPLLHVVPDLLELMSDSTALRQRQLRLSQ